MKLLQHDLEFGASLEHIHSLLSDLGELERCDDALSDSRPGIVTIGLFRGWIVRLCEAAPGLPLPDYHARRSWSLEMKAVGPSGLTIFTDAAHSAFVWTWRARDRAGHSQYTEFNATNRHRQLRAAIADLPCGGAESGGRADVDPFVTDRLFEVVRPELQRMAVGEAGRPQAILDLIEALDDPDQVRTIWRRLRGFSVLHENCADGARLVKVGATLELVLLAVLERMQSFVDDALMRRDRRRPEHLRDLRALLEAAEAQPWGYDRRRYVRRLIVQQNLFAVVSSRAAGRAVLRDLLGYAGGEGSGLPLIDCNIWRRRDGDGRPRQLSRPLRAASGRDTPPATACDEELALHRKAWEMVRQVRLAGGELREVRAASSQLQRRRQLLLRQLQELADGGGRSGFPEELAFCRPSSRRGFSAVFDGVQPE